MSTISFSGLERQRARLGSAVDRALLAVVDDGRFIMGPEVVEFEHALAAYTGAPHALGCANGTDALTLILMAEGIGPGDLVFVPAFTFVATAEAVAQLGATPVFVDVDAASFNLDPARLEQAIAGAAALGRPRAVIAVDLFGLPADYDALRAVTDAADLVLIADAAQSIGAERAGTKAGNLARWTAASFFPSKPLGCYGDGGAVLCQDAEQAALISSLRFHGKGAHKYDNVRIGVNSRLDTLQAAVLLQKLAIFDAELAARRALADAYSAALSDVVTTPVVDAAAQSAWAQYTLRVPDRDVVAAGCAAAGVPTMVYYPTPLHRLGGYTHYPVADGGCPVAERLAGEVISLPMSGYVTDEERERVVAAVRG